MQNSLKLSAKEENSLENMTRFEQLITKSNKCTRKALSMPAGRMRDIWGQKGRELKEMAYNLSTEEASAEVAK